MVENLFLWYPGKVRIHSYLVGCLCTGLVRLSFHDAGSFSLEDNRGGANGCIHLDDPDNGGIAEIIPIVEEVYLAYQDIISRADFWALAANVALRDAQPAGGTSRHAQNSLM